MTIHILQQRKWKLRAQGQQRLFVQGSSERPTHVIMKAFLWALYLPAYPTMAVEIRVGDRYKPDVVAMDDISGKPLFWGESGQVSPAKIAALVRRYRETHFAVAKWQQRMEPFQKIIADALDGVKREAPFDLICFDANSAERFIDADGAIHISHDDLQWKRFD